jgi:hypothetical protein
MTWEDKSSRDFIFLAIQKVSPEIWLQMWFQVSTFLCCNGTIFKVNIRVLKLFKKSKNQISSANTKIKM